MQGVKAILEEGNVALPSGLTESIERLELAVERMEEIVSVADPVTEPIIDFFVDAGETIEDGFEDLEDEFEDLGDDIEDVGEAVVDGFEDAGEAVLDFLGF